MDPAVEQGGFTSGRRKNIKALTLTCTLYYIRRYDDY